MRFSSQVLHKSVELCCLQDPFEHLETYHDSWLDRQFIKYFANKMSQQLGGLSLNVLHTRMTDSWAAHWPAADVLIVKP